MTWTEWKGGECPVEPETVVEVQTQAPFAMPPAPAGHFRWEWPTGDSPAEIVGYRVVAPPEKPFSTRITEAEEKALDGLDALLQAISGPLRESVHCPEQQIELHVLGLKASIALTQKAAALARDYARKEG